MATVTPNYNWPVPTSTDYVAQGAVAIEALGDAIDATVFAGGGSGYVLLSSTSFTTQTQIIVNNVFSATYDNYAIQFDGFSSARNDLQYQLRDGSGNDTTAVYQRQLLNVAAGSISGVRLGNLSNGNIGYLAPQQNFVEGNISTPFASNKATSSLFKSTLNVGTSVEIGMEAGGYNANKSFTGIRFYMAAGTFTGSIRIYGLRNS